MTERGNRTDPEFRIDSLNSFGFLLRDSIHLDPDTMPYLVKVDRNSFFFRSLYDRVYSGQEKAESLESLAVINRNVERGAMLAVNDIGDILLSKKIFEIRQLQLTDRSKEEMRDWSLLLSSDENLPIGWSSIGFVHSHPQFDVVNHLALSLAGRLPEFGPVPATWSGNDFDTFLELVKYSNKSTEGLISPTQLSFMVATSRTKALLKNPEKVYKIIMDSTKNLPRALTRMKEIKYSYLIEDVDNISFANQLVSNLLLPPYHVFKELGVVLYSGNHWGLNNGSFMLERKI